MAYHNLSEEDTELQELTKMESGESRYTEFEASETKPTFDSGWLPTNDKSEGRPRLNTAARVSFYTDQFSRFVCGQRQLSEMPRAPDVQL